MTNKITFTKDSTYDHGNRDSVFVEFTDDTLDRVLEEFEYFLKRCDYHLPGNIGFINDQGSPMCGCGSCSCEDKTTKEDEMRQFIKIFLESFTNNPEDAK